jgi:hypothetical protein
MVMLTTGCDRRADSHSSSTVRHSAHRSESFSTYPPLAEQKAIAAVLGALDDKIELNRRMNATLEAMARALFQSWFVDFDPVRAKLDGRKPDRPRQSHRRPVPRPRDSLLPKLLSGELSAEKANKDQ